MSARSLLQSVAIALAASALFLYISSAPVSVLQTPCTSRRPLLPGSLFQSITGMIVGSCSGWWRCTLSIPASRTIRIGISRHGRALRLPTYSTPDSAQLPFPGPLSRITLCTFGMSNRIAGHDHSDTGSLSRPARLRRIAPVRFRDGRLFNLFWFAGASPLWECIQVGMRSLSGPSRQRCVLVLWTALQKDCKASWMTGTSTRAFGSSPTLIRSGSIRDISMQKIGAKDSSRCFPPNR